MWVARHETSVDVHTSLPLLPQSDHVLVTEEAPSGVASITVNDDGESDRVVPLFKMWYICQTYYIHVPSNESPPVIAETFQTHCTFRQKKTVGESK